METSYSTVKLIRLYMYKNIQLTIMKLHIPQRISVALNGHEKADVTMDVRLQII